MSCPGPNRLTMTMKALSRPSLCSLFFFNDTATTEIYTLSLHDALPICRLVRQAMAQAHPFQERRRPFGAGLAAGERHSPDRKSTRLNCSHAHISYAVLCLKKKKNRAERTVTHTYTA